MATIIPVGSKLLVLPLEKQNYITEAGIEIAGSELNQSKVIEVGEQLSEVFKKGDIVIHPESAGISQPYKGKIHLWLDGQAPNLGGDVWGKIVKDK